VIKEENVSQFVHKDAIMGIAWRQISANATLVLWVRAVMSRANAMATRIVKAQAIVTSVLIAKTTRWEISVSFASKFFVPLRVYFLLCFCC
jgi:hypothetical protein